jgi:hypothetical protein
VFYHTASTIDHELNVGGLLVCFVGTELTCGKKAGVAVEMRLQATAALRAVLWQAKLSIAPRERERGREIAPFVNLATITPQQEQQVA